MLKSLWPHLIPRKVFTSWVRDGKLTYLIRSGSWRLAGVNRNWWSARLSSRLTFIQRPTASKRLLLSSQTALSQEFLLPLLGGCEVGAGRANVSCRCIAEVHLTPLQTVNVNVGFGEN